MRLSKIATHVALSDALKMGPAPKGNLAVPIFNYGSMAAELYTPSQHDPQKPHLRDEIYIVAHGNGEFFDGNNKVLIREGSIIFVPAGTEHHFENFSGNFAVWVFFYGPKGGEKNEP